LPQVQPFAGIRYNPEKIPDLSLVVAPPYDVIDADHHVRLMRRDPANAVRLILGSSPGSPGDYTAGAKLMAKWLKEGIFIRDPEPRYYIIEDTFELPGVPKPFRRWAIIGRVGIEPFETGSIFPHERTHSGPKEDRLRLMRAFKGNLSQVFALFDGDPSGVRALIDPVFGQPCAADMVDEKGVRRRFWVVKNPEIVNGISSLLGHRNLYIADGHHRYETALTYSREMAAADPSPSPERGYNFVMMALVGMEDPGLAILPVHRLLHGFRDFHFSRILSKLSDTFVIGPPVRGEPAGPESIASRRSPGHRGFTLFDPGSKQYVSATLREDVDLVGRMPDISPPIRCLEVTLAERFLMMDSLGMSADQLHRQEHLAYYHDLEEGRKRALEYGQLLVIMPPTSLGDLVAVTELRERMPQKSTFFYPKLLSGLVFHDHGSGA
jgi:uncharacterized protein (DUF1015 family)